MANSFDTKTTRYLSNFPEVPIIFSRYLNRAGKGIPHPKVIETYFEYLLSQDGSICNECHLRSLIAKAFGLTQNITFRPNTTQAFKDVIESLVFWGGTDQKNVRSYNPKILISDIDHPALVQVLSTLLSDSMIHKIDLLDFLLTRENELNNIIAEKYLHEIIKDHIQAVVIPHVVWINGAKIDVKHICKMIKDYNKSIITIVDGAQAVGNTELSIDENFNEDFNIDFYMGCGQKWIGSPEPTGFLRIGSRFLQEKHRITQFLFVNDFFSICAGKLEYLSNLHLGTNHYGLCKAFFESLKLITNEDGTIENSYFDESLRRINAIKNIIETSTNKLNDFRFILPPKEMQTGILTFTGRKNLLTQVSKNLSMNNFAHTISEFSFQKDIIPFIRLSAPVNDLSNEDVDLLTRVFKDNFASSAIAH